jgi:hypothetical protein
MVQQALNRHPAIAIPPETKFFFSFLGHPIRRQRRHLDRLNTDLDVHLRLPEGGVRTDDEARAFYETMADEYVKVKGRAGVQYFGEKTPEHTAHIGRIRRLYPDSKILVLVRDGRDVALSLSKAPWMSGGLYVGLLVWLYYQRLVLRAEESGLSNLYFARYEDIVTNPHQEFRSILEFLDLPYHPAVAEGSGNTDGSIPEREFAWKANALKKINTERVGAFRTELTESQIDRMERLGGRTLETFGYSLMTGGRDRLSPRFLAGLSFRTAAFAAHLPWYTLLHEFLDPAFV